MRRTPLPTFHSMRLYEQSIYFIISYNVPRFPDVFASSFWIQASSRVRVHKDSTHPAHSTQYLTIKSTIKFLKRLLLAFTSSSTGSMSKYPVPESFPVQKTAEEWRAELSPEDHQVIRNKVCITPRQAVTTCFKYMFYSTVVVDVL